MYKATYLPLNEMCKEFNIPSAIYQHENKSAVFWRAFYRAIDICEELNDEQENELVSYNVAEDDSMSVVRVNKYVMSSKEDTTGQTIPILSFIITENAKEDK